MYSFGLHGISPSDTMIPYVALVMQGYISAKMLLIAWTLMKKKEAFDPAYLNVE
jgi:hypothetical protein